MHLIGWTTVSWKLSSTASFELHFRIWIRLLYASPCSHGGSERDQVETLHFDSLDSSGLSPVADAVRSYARTFLAQVKGELGPTRPHITWYTAYTNDVSALATSSAEVSEMSKEIGMYEVVTGGRRQD